jgi:predicted rRNA methylase YqxC with S4 and FtsJ domains
VVHYVRVYHLALSCSFCNKNKDSDIASIDPMTKAIVALFKPRFQLWSQRFQLKKGLILALPPEARTTVKLLKINQQNRVREREILISAGIM